MGGKKRFLLIGAIAGAVTAAVVTPAAVISSGKSNISPIQGGTINTTSPWTCSGAVSLDLVKIELHDGKDAAIIGKNCTGTIERVEIDTWTGDAIKVQNSAPVAHDLTINGGYIVCHDKSPVLHQDGIQVMGGTSISLNSLDVRCGRIDATLVDAELFINKSGSGDSTPTDVVCDHCYLGPYAAHTVNLGESVRSGARNSILCPDKTPFGGVFDESGGSVDPVNENNETPAVC